jgi:hypothetical protein
MLPHFLNAVWVTVFGNAIWGLYMGQFILYAAAVAVLFYFMRKFTFSIWQVIFISLLLLTQTPAVANLFTVGKAEVALIFFSVFYLFALYKFLMSERIGALWPIVLGILSLALNMTKETDIAIFVPLVFLLAAFWIFKFGKMCIIKALLAIAIYIFAEIAHILFIHFFDIQPVDYNPYTSLFVIAFEPILNNFLWYLRNSTDIFITGVVSLLGNLYFYMKDRKNLRLLFGLAISVWGWAYMVGMFVWWILEIYYMLIPSTLFIMSLVFMLKEIKHPPQWTKRVFYGMFGVFIFMYGQYVYYTAITQADVNRAYTKSMVSASEFLSAGDDVFLEGLATLEATFQTMILHSYIWETGIRFHDLGLMVDNRQFLMDYLWRHFFLWEAARAYGFTSGMDFPLPDVGGYVLVHMNHRDIPFPVRGTSPRQDYRATSRLIGEGYGLELVSFYERSRNHFFLGMANIWGTRQTSAGYRLYRITYVPEHIRIARLILVTSGLFWDGWTGGVLSIEGFAGEGLRLDINPISFMVHPQNSIRVFINDYFAETISFDYTVTSLNLTNIVSQFADSDWINIRIEVERLFNPSINMPPSNDTRDLGLNVGVLAQ